MKNALIIGMTLLFGSFTFANSGVDGNSERLVFKCNLKIQAADNRMEMELTKGGLVGPKITIKRSQFTGGSEKTYVVHEVLNNRPGSPQIYKGAGVSFSINMTVSPLPNGLHAGFLKTKEAGTEEVLCSLQ